MQASVGAALAAGTCRGAEATECRIIDTHTHFYDPSRSQGVPWPPKDSPLYRTVLPEDWRAVAGPCGVRETVVVEASQWVEDNQWVLDLAEQDKSIVGLVGNLDPHSEAFASDLKRFAENPLYRGIRWRSNLVSLDEGHDRVVAGARLLAELDLSLDVNGPPSVLESVNRLAGEVPGLRIVIDHVGGAGDPGQIRPGWAEAMQALARRSSVYVKVSGLPEQTKASWGEASRDPGYYLPILNPLWEWFGEDRLIFGSNWPVSDKGAPYSAVMGIVSPFFESKGADAAAKYFAGNAKVGDR
jgi:predicted TIM-barrel fold metal-dependent hydrolase